MGTFGGALEARQIDASHGRLIGEVTGEIETEDGVLIIRRIHVRYELRASADDQETIQRVHDIHHSHCPVYRSLHRAIDISTEFEIVNS